MAATAKARREEKVRKMFADLGMEFSAEKAKPYLEMSESAIDAVANDLKSLKPAPAETLFADQATSGTDEVQGLIDSMSKLDG